jgi:hypothetical protein
VSYPTTKNRLQVTTADGKNPAAKFHEDRGDGTPVCKLPLRDYQGQRPVFTSRGPGVVTCDKCSMLTSS